MRRSVGQASEVTAGSSGGRAKSRGSGKTSSRRIWPMSTMRISSGAAPAKATKDSSGEKLQAPPLCPSFTACEEGASEVGLNRRRRVLSSSCQTTPSTVPRGAGEEEAQRPGRLPPSKRQRHLRGRARRQQDQTSSRVDDVYAVLRSTSLTPHRPFATPAGPPERVVPYRRGEVSGAPGVDVDCTCRLWW